MSWMLQDLCNQTAENRKLIDKILRTVDKTSEKTQSSTNPRDCERCFMRWLNRLGEHPRNDSWEDYLNEEDSGEDYDDEDDDYELREMQNYWMRFRENNEARTAQQHHNEENPGSGTAASAFTLVHQIE